MPRLFLTKKIRIVFTPDEEVGRGVDFFDVKKFGADFAYTIDGGFCGELNKETFSADSHGPAYAEYFHGVGKSSQPDRMALGGPACEGRGYGDKHRPGIVETIQLMPASAWFKQG